MSINTPKGPEKRDEAHGNKQKTPVQKQVSETKKKADEAQRKK